MGIRGVCNCSVEAVNSIKIKLAFFDRVGRPDVDRLSPRFVTLTFFWDAVDPLAVKGQVAADEVGR
jgi:hypothetical protein